MDRISVSEAEGWGFNSPRAYFCKPFLIIPQKPLIIFLHMFYVNRKGVCMKINGINNFQIIQNYLNFKGNSGNSNLKNTSEAPQTTSVDVSKAYAAPQITEGYREIKTFDVPYVGKGKLYELANGHKVVLIHKEGPTTINTYVGAGNFNEPADKKQTSHLLEHLMAGACMKPKNKEVETFFKDTGAYCNAATSNFSTNYYIQTPIENPKDFENLVKSQLVSLTNTGFSEEDVENEKDIVTQELNSINAFNRNELLAEKITLQNLFSLKDSDDAIAQRSVNTIKSIKKEDLINYYNTFYRPNNMITTVVGNVDENSIKTIAKYLGTMQAQTPEKKIDYPEVSTENPIKTTTRKDIRSLDPNAYDSYWSISFIGPQNEDSKARIISDALRNIIENKVKNYSEKNNISIYADACSSKASIDKNAPTILSIEGSSDNKNVEKNLKIIYSILYNLNQKQISDEELEKAKNSIRSDESSGSESANDLSDWYSLSLLSTGDVNFESQYLNILNSITPKDIQDYAKKYLDLNKASITVIHPQDETKEITNEKIKPNTISIATENIKKENLQDIHEYILPNNLRVVIDSRPGITRSTVKFDLNSKKTLYANPRAEVALAFSLISKDTKNELAQKGINSNADGYSQGIFSELSSDPDKTLEILGYAAGILLKPDFSQKTFNSTKSSLKFLDEPQEKPFLNEAVLRELIGDSYSLINGNLKGLELNDVKYLHAQMLKNAQGTVFITIPKEELNKIQDQIFQTLMGVPSLKPYNYKTIWDKTKPVELKNTKIFTRTDDKENQIEVEKTYKTIESGNIVDRAGLLLLNEVIGGDDKSLLFKYLRNQDRIVYTPYSKFSPTLSSGKISSIMLSAEVAATEDNLKKVVEEYDKITNGIIEKPLTQEELEIVKAQVKNKLLAETETSEGKNSQLSDGYNSFYGISYQQTLLEAIDKMTPEYLQALAQYYFKQPYLMSVSGNKKVIEDNKNYLSNLGEIVECS